MVSAVESYIELEFQLYGEMIQLRELQKAVKNELEVERISKVIDTLKTRTFRVAVVGEFKRGKSSLIKQG
jgi:ribosome biogenesis GTPase A